MLSRSRSTLAEPGETVEEPADGLSILTAQVERRSRAVPPPRKPRPRDPSTEGPAATPSSQNSTAEALRPDIPPRHARPQPVSKPKPAERPGPRPDEPLANLAVRVRRSLDDQLVDLIHALRRDGIRTSKVELLELLLWELPSQPTPELRARLGQFRKAAPREEPL